jgi:hypothetical protein
MPCCASCAAIVRLWTGSAYQRRGCHRRELGDGLRSQRTQDAGAFLCRECFLDVFSHPRQRARRSRVMWSKVLFDLPNDARRKGRCGAARVDADREIADPHRCSHREVAFGRVGCVASQHARCVRVGDDSGIELAIVGCGDDERRIRHVRARISARRGCTTVCGEQGTQLIADERRHDENREASIDERFGFARGDFAAAHDYGVTAIRPERDGEHTNTKRLPRPAVKDRLACCVCKFHRDPPARPSLVLSWRPWLPCRAWVSVRCGTTAKRPTAKSLAKSCSPTTG